MSPSPPPSFRDLISPGYLAQQRELHARPEGYGGSGHKLAGPVLRYARQLGARTLLDYGCGEGTLKAALTGPRGASGKVADLRAEARGLTVAEFDPAVSGKHGLPKGADLVVCTDVLEHIEPERLAAVLAHLRSLARLGAFLVIALRPANKTLPDGRNAHLIIEPAAWWLWRVINAGFAVRDAAETPGHSLTLWCR